MSSRALLVGALLALTPRPALAHTHLVLIGGGTRPRAALQRFVEWSGGASARLLVIPWATAEPDASFAAIRTDLDPLHPASVELAPSSPLKREDRERFLAQLAKADVVLITGGDQKRLMAVLEDKPLLTALRNAYARGVTFAGTSAGTAVMSRTMISGDGDPGKVASPPTAPGLGLLPEGVVVDQHFLRRQRENRLFGLVLAHPDWVGVGIDEGNALLVTDGDDAEVVGPTQVMTVEARTLPRALVVRLQPSGSHFRLLQP